MFKQSFLARNLEFLHLKKPLRPWTGIFEWSSSAEILSVYANIRIYLLESDLKLLLFIFFFFDVLNLDLYQCKWTIKSSKHELAIFRDLVGARSSSRSDLFGSPCNYGFKLMCMPKICIPLNEILSLRDVVASINRSGERCTLELIDQDPKTETSTQFIFRFFLDCDPFSWGW